MLAMTKKTGYGLIAMSHLARLADGKLASAREIAEEYGIPQALLMNVLKELSAADYVDSVRGAHGGYRLARDPGEIDFIGMMEVLEGPVKLAECVTGDVDGGTCRLMPTCPIADPVHRVHRKIHDFLAGLTLTDILAQNEQAQADEGCPSARRCTDPTPSEAASS